MSYQPHPYFYAVRRYLARPAPNWFWRWDDSGDVLLWRDLQTIAFREELIAVLEPHTTRGLPPFDCVVLLFAATRRSWPEAKEQVASWNLFNHQRRLGPGAVELLDKVHDLPEALRETLEAKAELFRLVFETFGARLSPEESRAVLDMLTAGPSAELLAPKSTGARIEAIGRTISDAFCRGLAKVDAEALRLRRKTGLEELPGPAPDDLMPSARARALITSLQDDEELGGLARVARRLLGAVHLPHHVSEQQDLPLGGVSDLTNRGDLDRLLLSELAHDDLTLAVRIALNEALYLRRESPPRIPPSGRAFLIDSGIRMWGIPRVFAAAAGMALTAASDRQTRILSFRSQGPQVVPADLSIRDGLVEQLEALEPDPHPGAALRPFFEACMPDKEPVDCVIITCEDVLRDDEFQRQLAEYSSLSLYVATVSRKGQFRLELRAPRGSRVVREVELDLDTLFAKPRRKMTPLVDRRLCSSLPAILSVKPFPLRLSIDENRILLTWSVPPYGRLSLTKDGRLLHWDRRNLGALQIAEHLPHLDQLYWSTPEPREGKAQAVVGYSTDSGNSEYFLLMVDLKEADCQIVKLLTDGWPAVGRSVCGHNGALFVRCGNMIQVYEKSTGRRIERIRTPHDSPFTGDQSACTRFTWSQQHRRLGWHALSFDGLRASWVRVTCGSGEEMPRLIALFDWHGHDGPMGIATNGDLFCTATGEWTRLRPQLWEGVTVHEISPRGDRLAFAEPTILFPEGSSLLQFSGRFPVVETETGAVSPLRVYPRLPGERRTTFFQVSSPPQLNEKGLRSGFKAILIDEQGQLALVSRKGHLWRIALDLDRNRLTLRHVSRYHPADGQTCDCRKWQSSGLLRVGDRVVEHPKKSYRLRVAKWRDGSRAYFDSRGLLHLVSSVRTIPEVTIVLCPRTLSGWCSDGRTWGDRYFIEPNESAYVIYNEVLRPFAKAAQC